MQTHTSVHTHTHTHMPYAILPDSHAHELTAERVICDAFTLGGREELGSVSVCLDLSFLLSLCVSGIGTIFRIAHQL